MVHMQNAPSTVERTAPAMLRPTPVKPGQISNRLRGLLDRSDIRMEEIPNFLKILAKSPTGALVYMRVDGTLASGQLSESQREQIALA